jgi:single-stranded DNA-binding protein
LLFTLVLGGFARGRRSTRQARLSRSSVRGADLLRTHRLGSPADNLAETAVKGSGLVVADELTVEDYTDRTGRTRTTTRITASHLGLSTRFASRPAAQPTREVITATP